MSSVPCAHNWGDPSILRHVDTGKEETIQRHVLFCWCLQLVLVGVYSNFLRLGRVPIHRPLCVHFLVSSLPWCNIWFLGVAAQLRWCGIDSLICLTSDLPLSMSMKRRANCTHYNMTFPGIEKSIWGRKSVCTGLVKIVNIDKLV
jgi:hypothetical protein